MTYTDLAVYTIRPNPDQPRKLFDADKLRELSESIAANGLLEPIIVRADPRDPDGWLIIAGERRWRASTMAGIATVPARILEVDEVQAYVLSVAENVNRDDMTVMEEARAYAQLVLFGKSNDEIAAIFGKRIDMVAARLLLMDLEPHGQAMVEAGTLGPRLAWEIAKLDRGNQRVVLQRWARGEISVDDAVQFAGALLEAQTAEGFFDLVEPTAEERATHARSARRVTSQADQIERLSALLSELSEADAADLAAALGNDVGRRLASFDRVARQVRGIQGKLRKAKAIAEARTMAVR